MSSLVVPFGCTHLILSICKAVRVVASKGSNVSWYYVSIARRSSHTGKKKNLGQSPNKSTVYYPVGSIGSTFADDLKKARIKSSNVESKLKAEDVAAEIRGDPSLMKHALTMVSETDPPVMTLTSGGGGVQENLICTSQYPISPIASLLMIDEDDDLVSRK